LRLGNILGFFSRNSTTMEGCMLKKPYSEVILPAFRNFLMDRRKSQYSTRLPYLSKMYFQMSLRRTPVSEFM